MAENFEAVLAACIERLEAGEEPEEVLARYAEEAEELAPLLELVVELEGLREVEPPREGALQGGRERFLAEAERMGRGEKRAERGWLELLAGYVWRGLAVPARAAVAGAVLFLVVGTGAVLASADSIPGDALYRVKRTSERVRVLLAIDEAEQVRLREMYAERRRGEAQEAARRGRTVPVEFSGEVQRIAEGSWTVSGLEVVVDSETEVHGRTLIGARLNVRAIPQPDGTLLARQVTVVQAPPVTATVTPTRTLAPTETPMAQERVDPTSTRTATRTATSTATKRSPPTDTPTLESPAKPTATPTRTPTPPRTIMVKFSGRIQAMGPEAWTVAGRRVRIGAKTEIDGPEPAVGSQVTIEAVRQANGALLARRIQVQAPPSEPAPTPEIVEFKGVIEKLAQELWVVSGIPVSIDTKTQVEGHQPQVGLSAEVRARRRPDGTLLAISIQVQSPEIVEFEGIVEEKDAEAWVISGRTVLVLPDTDIQGMAVVGAYVEVRAEQRPDGTLLARLIRVQASPTSTSTRQPTATVTPSPSPTETATSVPRATSTPLALPSITPLPTDTPTPASVGSDGVVKATDLGRWEKDRSLSNLKTGQILPWHP